ncbi:MAG TPA: LytR C-terminal domain-containing protein [Solirubrobacteraceae bacterium]|nr:LytR C-terminal domain-containing protein [Solirubrobacteraceae bacterium]
MRDLPLAAVALGDEIERYGSYFGYAAIIGLGVLSLLYFAQAREVRRLREWAGRAPERDAEVVQRVQSDAQRRVVAQPMPSTASPQTPAAQSADAARKAAAAAVMEKFQPPGSAPTASTGPAAPAIGPPGSLTRATPAVGAPAPAGEAEAAAPPAAPGAPAPSPATAASGSAESTSAESTSAESASAASDSGAATAPAAAGGGAAADAARSHASAAGAPKPPTAPETASSAGSSSGSAPPMPPGMSAATANAVAAARQAATSSRSPAHTNGADPVKPVAVGGQETHESDAARPAPLPELPPRRPRAPLADAHDGDGGVSRRRIGAIVAASAVVLVLGIVLVLVLRSGGTEKPSAGNQIGDASPPAAVSPPAPASGLTKAERTATSVAVLNGTTQTGLASAVAQTIEKKGFTILATKTNADQQIATTTVSYAPGGERAARAVAQIMRVPSSAIGPIDANTSVAASPEAKIVVLVGTDKSGAG